MNTQWINISIGLIVLIYAFVFMIYTPHKRIQKASWMKGHFSHRGLFTQDQKIPENSLVAFRHSLQAGYGIELDIVLSSDDQIMVFHDDDLVRACSVHKNINECRYEELKSLTLFNTQETIPTLTEVLDVVQGKVPLMIELKTTTQRKRIVTKLKHCLESYQGPYTCVSFDPLIVLELKKMMPSVLRGQLMEPSLKKKNFSLAKRLILHFGLLNGMTRPDYLSVHVHHRNITYRINRWLKGFGVVWPVNSKELEKTCQNDCDMIIFEHYQP